MKTTDNTQRFNSYTYANNNPMRFVDPTGYDGFDDVYTGPGMQTWVKPEQDSGSGEAGGGGGGGGGNGFHYSYTDHAYEDANGNIVGWNYVFYDFVQANAVNFTGPVFKITSQGIDIPFIDTYQGGLEIGDKWITWQDLVNYSSPGAGSGFDPSMTEKYTNVLFSTPGLEMKDYSTKTRGGGSPIEFVTNLRNGKLESVNVYNIMGDHFSFGTNGDITYGNVFSFGFNPSGSLILDLSLPTGSKSSIGLTIQYNPDVFINNANYFIMNTIGDALERRHRIFAPYPFDEELIPEFFLLP